jgi:hypothetical protein
MGDFGAQMMRMHFDKVIVLLVASSFPGSAVSYEFSYRDICGLMRGSDESGRYKVVSAKEYCPDRQCVAVQYEAVAEDRRRISFVSPARLGVGDSYLLFLSRLTTPEFLLPTGAEYYSAPKGIRYFVALDAAYGLGPSGLLYRELPSFPCIGAGDTCDVMQGMPRELSGEIISAKVIFRDFEKKKSECMAK